MGGVLRDASSPFTEVDAAPQRETPSTNYVEYSAFNQNRADLNLRSNLSSKIRDHNIPFDDLGFGFFAQDLNFDRVRAPKIQVSLRERNLKLILF